MEQGLIMNKERLYGLASNRANIRAIKHALRDINSGYDFCIPDTELDEIIKILTKWERKTYGVINND